MGWSARGWHGHWHGKEIALSIKWPALRHRAGTVLFFVSFAPYVRLLLYKDQEGGMCQKYPGSSDAIPPLDVLLIIEQLACYRLRRWSIRSHHLVVLMIEDMAVPDISRADGWIK